MSMFGENGQDLAVRARGYCTSISDNEVNSIARSKERLQSRESYHDRPHLRNANKGQCSYSEVEGVRVMDSPQKATVVQPV